MPQPPKEFIDLLPKQAVIEPQEGPTYWLFVFDPHTGDVIVEDNDNRPRYQAITHGDLAERIPHPGRIHGYVYRIRGGYRVTDWEHRPITDPYIVRQVIDKLNGKDVRVAHTSLPEVTATHYGRPMGQ